MSYAEFTTILEELLLLGLLAIVCLAWAYVYEHGCKIYFRHRLEEHRNIAQLSAELKKEVII